MVDVQHGKLTTTGDSLPVSILLVASEDERQSAWRRFLQQQGCTLTMVSSGADGLELLSRQRTDVIIAEVNVPEMDGLAFFEKARPMSADAIRILAAPAEVKGRMLEAMARGVLNQFLATPWNELELRALLDQTIHMQRDMRIQQVRKELQKMPNLPVPSRFYLKVQEMLSKDDLSLQKLSREIEQNPSFVARILQVANSVHFWTRSNITTVSEALGLIGTNYIATLILGIEMFENVMKNAPAEAKTRYETIWKNALGRAIIARHIAHSSPGSVDPGNAHVASLLQDIGLLMRLCADPKRYLSMESLAIEQSVSLYEAEWRTFGMTHDHLGAGLLELWNFSPQVVIAVANQHWDTFGDALTSIIQVADRLTTPDPYHRYDLSLDPLIEFWRERLQVFLVGVNSPKQAEPGGTKHD